ncbi:MAG: hypothetical protein H7645_04825 [Candidatus Heimdallarchaeota archaeon]|nr:hypothetical protein [Candidatus Heimdallarchaeota archaeon]MCK4769642.1 hypothetical protein [Candidatus Heimdallarchaeota archaeon]
MWAIALLYIGSIIIFLWGVGHLFPTKNIVEGFGDLSEDNKKIITMEWIAEGLALCFLGLLPLFLTIFSDQSEVAFFIGNLCCVSMLVVLAILSFFTGAKTSVLPMKLCPFIKLTGATLMLLGTMIYTIPL